MVSSCCFQLLLVCVLKVISGVENHLLIFGFYKDCGVNDVLGFHGDPCVEYMLDLLKFLWSSD